ncbi:MAG: response regulator transcription factor [Cyanobacteria bacterium P01_E01_bin.35]
MRILLVDDDPEQLEPLQIALSRSGHIVDGAADGATARWLVEEKNYDLLILDWMLPEASGIDLCQFFRAAGVATPILLLTAKDTIDDKVIGLDAGADDYLVKPVDLTELLARVRALRRRSPLWTGDRLQLADLCLHLDTMRVEWKEISGKLSSRDFQLLEYMMRHPGKILTHEQIEQALWSWGSEPESNAVAGRVRRLRQGLREIGVEDWIKSIYGLGYCFEPPKFP